MSDHVSLISLAAHMAASDQFAAYHDKARAVLAALPPGVVVSFGGGAVKPKAAPRGRWVNVKERNAEWVTLRKFGTMPRDIAARYNVKVQTVYNALLQAKHAGNGAAS